MDAEKWPVSRRLDTDKQHSKQPVSNLLPLGTSATKGPRATSKTSVGYLQPARLFAHKGPVGAGSSWPVLQTAKTLHTITKRQGKTRRARTKLDAQCNPRTVGRRTASSAQHRVCQLGSSGKIELEGTSSESYSESDRISSDWRAAV